MSVRIAIERLAHAEGLPLPEPATTGSAGYDLCAAIGNTQTLAPGERALVPAGFCIALPDGIEAQIRPRSGLALDHGITVLNSPGTIDSDYRGEVGVVLINMGQKPFVVRRGERIAQMVIAQLVDVRFEIVDELDGSARGQGGFGSTGIRHAPKTRALGV
ncbi:MAG TPA: dUTP diphosphatase [Alphaproteobacteria bacterium]|jgi:dUTP pyrophosphatase|nr:dUTP diphosphatase [Alphaproteobacteria bacterium]